MLMHFACFLYDLFAVTGEKLIIYGMANVEIDLRNILIASYYKLWSQRSYFSSFGLIYFDCFDFLYG